MATFFDLLSRRSKPQRPVPSVPRNTVGERLAAEMDVTAAEYNVPAWFLDSFKADLKDAFSSRGAYRPGYEPGAVVPVDINFIDVVTNPFGVAKKLGQAVTDVSKWRDFLPTLDPLQELGITKAERDVWKNLCTTQWAGAVPASLKHALSVWGDNASRYGARLVKEIQLKSNPGLALMMATELQRFGVTQVGGVPIGTIIAEAQKAEVLQAVGEFVRADGTRVAAAGLAGCLNAAEQAAALGRWEEADYFWGQADRIQRQWAGTYCGKAQSDLIAEFGRQMRLNPDLADTPAGRLWRYWQARNYRYMTLNFLKTWHDKGILDVFYQYAWTKATKKLGLWYPPMFINKKIIDPLLKPLLTRLTALRTAMNRLRKKFITEPLKKAARWLIGKLGLKALGTKIGTLVGSVVAPGAGSAAGAVIGAVASFLLELVIDKLGGIIKVASGIVIGAFALLLVGPMMGVMLFIILVILIFNVNASFPGEAGPGFEPGPLAPPSVVRVVKEACEGAGCTSFEPFLRLPVKESVYHVRWRITLTNTEDTDHTGSLIDEECFSTTMSYRLGPHESTEFLCEKTVYGGEDRLVINSVSGTVVGESPFRGTGILMIGAPGACLVPGVPYYCQCGEEESGVACREGQGHTVCTYGCGPTSEAMLINYHCGGEVTTPGQLASNYGCGAVSSGATRDILGGNLSAGQFGAKAGADTFFAPIYDKLCAGRPVITTISHPEISVGHISLIVGIDMTARKIYLNDSYVSCRLGDKSGAYSEYDLDTYYQWVNTSNYWYWGGELHPSCNR